MVEQLPCEAANERRAGTAMRRSMAFLAPSRYRHPEDVEAREILKNTTGLDHLVRLYNEHFHERMDRILNCAERVRGDGRCPIAELFRSFRGCCERLGVAPMPGLFLAGDGPVAYTSGIEEPFISLRWDLAERCSPAELEFILGHELGHIRLDHGLYFQLADWATYFVDRIPLIGEYLAKGLAPRLYQWQRAAEFSADRAGLLVCQDVNAALRVMMILSGVPRHLIEQANIAAFLDQARDFEKLDEGWLNSMTKTWMGWNRTHPWTVMHGAEIQRWHGSDEYTALLAEGTGSSACGTRDRKPASATPTSLPLFDLPPIGARRRPFLF